MKWFGVDYRYVIAGVGAVFILAYEFVGTQSGEIQPDKQEAQNSKALSVEALNEKLASALTATSSNQQLLVVLFLRNTSLQLLMVSEKLLTQVS